jgi:hypothetical protein
MNPAKSIRTHPRFDTQDDCAEGMEHFNFPPKAISRFGLSIPLIRQAIFKQHALVGLVAYVALARA